jgi:uridine phosphorylase
MSANKTHPRIEAAREKMRPLGIHTSVGHLQKFNKWKEISFLKDNSGRVPPFIISVGSRARVFHSANFLKFREKALIDVEAMDKFGIPCFGRVALLVGLAESKAGTFPLMVAESQMGCPAAQINMRELLYFANPEGYNASGNFYPSDSVYVIRAGTCAGVNGSDPESHQMEIGDLAISRFSIGSIGAALQSNYGLLDFAGRSSTLEQETIPATKDKKYLSTVPSPGLARALEEKANCFGLRFAAGANFSKDSLYAEMEEQDFMQLRDRYGVISTEMEQVIIDMLASDFSSAGMPVQSALIAAVVGAIPGRSFPGTKEEYEAAAKAEENALMLANETLGEIASRFS